LDISSISLSVNLDVLGFLLVRGRPGIDSVLGIAFLLRPVFLLPRIGSLLATV